MDSDVGKYQVTLVSFGYQNGVPDDVEHTYSVRHLPNPSRAERVRNTGTSPTLQVDLFKQHGVQEFYDGLLKSITERLAQAEKSLEANSSKDQDQDQELELRLGVGCEKGVHRSVAIVERLVHDLTADDDVSRRWSVAIEHRDVSNADGAQQRGMSRAKTLARNTERNRKAMDRA